MNDKLLKTRYSNTEDMYQHFVLEMSPVSVLELLSVYNLKAEDLTGNFNVDINLLEGLHNKHEESHHSRVISKVSALHLTKVLSQWPATLTWLEFNEQINRLLIAWLEDYKNGATLDTGLIIVSHLLLNKPLENNCISPSDSILTTQSNTKFNLLMMHLIAKITNQLDQYRFNYIENIDIQSGLPNQLFLLKILQQKIASRCQADINSHHDRKHFGLIIVNLNLTTSQKNQTDTITTQLIKSAADVIHKNINDDSTLFLVGENELGVLVDNLNFTTQINLIVAKIANGFEHALPTAASSMIIKPYFGCVSSFNLEDDSIINPVTDAIQSMPIDSAGIEEIASVFYGYAKLALNHAIANNYQVEVYDYHIKNVATNLHALDEAIIEALQQNTLSIHLQPIITLPHEDCLNAEILIRWQHPEWHDVSAMRLIDTIYKKGFGKVFIRWLINTTCQVIGELIATHQQPIALTINLSMNDLLNDDLPDLLAQSIALWDISAEHLIIEITESDFLVDEVRAGMVIDKIAQLGCKLALDDFGTGYSSMARLRNMPIHFVKIDQSFVRSIAHSSQDKYIVQSIIELAQSLGKQVVAEGVEDQACLTLLKEMGCEKVQGYVYAKPMPSEDFSHWLTLYKHKRQVLNPDLIR
jgi:diguanylate cyclase